MGWACSKKGCSDQAVVFPIVYIWAQGDHERPKARAIPLVIALPYCGPCSTVTDVWDILTPGAFLRVSDALTKQGRVAPDRSSARIEFKLLNQFQSFVPAESGIALPPENWQG